MYVPTAICGTNPCTLVPRAQSMKQHVHIHTYIHTYRTPEVCMYLHISVGLSIHTHTHPPRITTAFTPLPPTQPRHATPHTSIDAASLPFPPLPSLGKDETHLPLASNHPILAPTPAPVPAPAPPATPLRIPPFLTHRKAEPDISLATGH